MIAGHQRLHDQAAAAEPGVRVAAPRLGQHRVARLEPGPVVVGAEQRRAPTRAPTRRPRPRPRRAPRRARRAGRDRQRRRPLGRTDPAPDPAVLVDAERRVAAAVALLVEDADHRARPVGPPHPHLSLRHGSDPTARCRPSWSTTVQHLSALGRPNAVHCRGHGPGRSICTAFDSPGPTICGANPRPPSPARRQCSIWRLQAEPNAVQSAIRCARLPSRHDAAGRRREPGAHPDPRPAGGAQRVQRGAVRRARRRAERRRPRTRRSRWCC